MTHQISRLADHRNETDPEGAREAADALWRILRYAANQPRPRGWQEYDAEARHYASVIELIVNEHRRVAGADDE